MAGLPDVAKQRGRASLATLPDWRMIGWLIGDQACKSTLV
jgi:hypothetical protein